MPKRGPATHWYVAGIVILLGWGLRLYGIDFGLPYLYNPDEPGLVATAGKMLANRDVNPHWFAFPGSTILNLLVAMFAAIYAIGRALGVYTSTADFVQMYFADPTVLYLSGRVAMSLVGAATIWLVYLIGKRLFGPIAAITAALIIATSSLHVAHSQLIRPDVPMTFFVLLAFWYGLEIMDGRRLRSYALAGMFLGLAVTTKYPGVMAVAPILTAHLSAGRPDMWRLRGLLLAAIVSLLTAFVMSPFLFIDLQTVLDWLTFEARDEHLSATGAGFLNNLPSYLFVRVPRALSVPTVALAALGIAGLLARRQMRHLAMVISFPLSLLLFLSSLNLIWDRWIIPVLPFVALLAGAAIADIMKAAERRTARGVAGALAAIITAYSVLTPLQASLAAVGARAGGDTRTIAREWVLANIPAGSRILLEKYSPELPKDRYELFGVSSKEPRPPHDIDPDPRPRFIPQGDLGTLRSAGLLEKEGIQYLILSDFYSRYRDRSNEYPERLAVYREIFDDSEILIEVRPRPGRIAGPTISVLRIGPPRSDKKASRTD